MKKSLIFISFIVFILLVGLLSIPYVIDVNNYKDEIVALVKEETGRQVEIKGKIAIRALPDIALTLNNVSVGSLLDEKENIIDVKKLVLKVKILPLFKKSVQVDSFYFIKPVISLHVLPSGQNNWEKSNLNTQLSNSDKNSSGKAGAGNIDDIASKEDFDGYLQDIFQFNKVKIVDGSFSFSDEEKKRNIKISRINLNTSLRPFENPFNLSGKLDVFDDKDKGHFSFKGSYYVDSNQYRIENVSMKLDNIEGNSSAALDFSSYIPDLQLTLYFGKLNFNSYKISKNDSKSDLEKIISKPIAYERKEEKFVWSQEPIDFSFLDKINAHLSFKSSGISYKDVSVGKVMLNTYLRNGKLTTHLKEANTYGGQVNAAFVLDNDEGTPNIEGKLNLSDINFAQAPSRLGVISSLGGTTNGQFNFHTTGENESEFISGLNGSINIEVTDGNLDGIDLLSMSNNITSAFNIGGVTRTKFQEISGDFDIKDGLMSNDNFILKSDVLNFTGKGNINLNDISINYKLIPEYSQDSSSQETKGTIVPILVSGDLRHPIFRLEVKAIVEDLINNPKGPENLVKQLKRDFKEVKKNIKKDIDNGVLKDLKNIFE